MMFGRLVEKVMGGIKPAEAKSSYFSRYIERNISKFPGRYEEAVRNGQSADAIDILAQLVLADLIPSYRNDSAMARAYFSILRDNDHLPMPLQLNESELTLLRDLLSEFFQGSPSFNSKGSEVLALIEKKFSSGLFSQARLLLQIFEADEETKLNNERNLFYEEMITRLSSQHAMCRNVAETSLEAMAKDEWDEEDIIREIRALASERDLNLLVFLKDKKEEQNCRAALAGVPNDVQEYLLSFVPVERWRLLGSLKDETIFSQVFRQIQYPVTVRNFIQAKLKMCYFLLLASGNTGAEWFIFAFTKWCKTVFDVDVLDLLPFVHKSGIVDSICLHEVLEIAMDRFFAPKLSQMSFDEKNVEDAVKKALKRIASLDLSTVPTGQFNFPALVLDELMPFEYEEPAFAFRLFEIM